MTLNPALLSFRFLISISVCLVGALHADTSVAQTLAAQITYPVSGAANVDLSLPIQWTTVANAQAYCLYVGSTPGAQDLLNSFEIQPASYLAAGLPGGRTVFARLWTEVGGVWRFSDSAFTTAAVAIPVIATLTSPVGAATNVDLTLPIQWTTVANAQAYCLYVGSTPGARDLLNSFEIQTTSYLATGVPSGQTVFARLWTKVSGVWRFSDSSFTTGGAAPVVATLTSPPNGATSVNLTLLMQWTSVVNAQAYCLYIGSTPGAHDLLNSFEIQSTSYQMAGLPWGQTVFARMWTKVGGIWRSADSSFTTGVAVPVVATLTSPVNGATNVDLTLPMRWTSAPNAQAYCLYVGSTPGANDLLNSFEIQSTSYLAAALPGGQIVFARLWTEVGGIWRSTDSSFTTGVTVPLVATLTYPVNRATNVDLTRPIQWTSVPNVQTYYLYLGSTAGASDILDSGELHLRSYLATLDVVAGQMLYTRIWTEVGGTWRYADGTFTASTPAEFLYPLDGTTGVVATQPFRWTPAAGAQAYRLEVGTSPGATDLVNSGALAGTSYVVSGLPPDGTLYARIWTQLNGAWLRHSDIAFTTAVQVAAAMMVSPATGTTTFDTAQPFTWSDVPLARGYRLTLGSGPGASDLHDSGVIHVTRRFVPNLPIGVPLFGRLTTEIAGQWYAVDFAFRVGANTIAAAPQVAAALWATALVRNMAGEDNRPYNWTELLQVASRYSAMCTDYAATLLGVLGEINLRTPARRLDLAFGLEGHTLVEMLNPATQTWMVLDPTFGLAAKRSSGEWATAEDISTATRTFGWNISYVFLDAAGDSYARAYYLDYPLLYVNVLRQGQVATAGSWQPYMETLTPPVSPPVSGNPLAYIVQCPGSPSVIDVVIDGSSTEVACSGPDSLSSAFIAFSVDAPAGGQSSFTLYRPRRFVF